MIVFCITHRSDCTRGSVLSFVRCVLYVVYCVLCVVYCLLYCILNHTKVRLQEIMVLAMMMMMMMARVTVIILNHTQLRLQKAQFP